jgi:hypothetical protein
MAKEYTNPFYSKALKNLPKLGFFGLKINHLATLVKTGLKSKTLRNGSLVSIGPLKPTEAIKR